MPMYGMPAGLAAFSGAGYGRPGFMGAFGGGLEAFGQAQADQSAASDRQLQGILDIARMQQQIRGAELEEAERRKAQAAALAQQGQAEELRMQLPRQYQELFDVDRATAIARAFPETLTADQAADNQLQRQKFEFEQAKYGNEQALAQQKLGRLSDEQSKFYVGKVGALNSSYDNALQRYQSATSSLDAGNATGDKAALVHMARLMSDEALNENDIGRMVSEGVLPGYFESWWNQTAGKGQLSDDQRRQIRGQLEREISSRHGVYSTGREYLAGTFNPAVIESERRRVLGDARANPAAAAQAERQRQQQAQAERQAHRGPITLEMVDQMSDEELDQLPPQLLEALEAQAAARSGRQVMGAIPARPGG